MHGSTKNTPGPKTITTYILHDIMRENDITSRASRSEASYGNSSKPCQCVQLNIAQLCLVLTHAEDDSPLILLYDWEKGKNMYTLCYLKHLHGRAPRNNSLTYLWSRWKPKLEMSKPSTRLIPPSLALRSSLPFGPPLSEGNKEMSVISICMSFWVNRIE